MNNLIGTVLGCLYLMEVIYTFIVWGTGWGILSIFFPIFPLIDITAWLITKAPWL